MFRIRKKSKVRQTTLTSDNRTCLERSNVLEPTRKKPSGLLAVALGITTAVASVGLLSDYMPGNSAFAQTLQPNVQVSAVQQPMTQNLTPGVQQIPALSPAALLQQSNQLLVAARTSLAGGDVVTAEQQFQQASVLKAPYTERDDRPEYVKPLIDGHKAWLQAQKAFGDTEQVRRMRAENLAYQADGFYRHNNLDMAEKLVRDAMAQNVNISSEMIAAKNDPQSIMTRINDAKLIRAAQNNTLGASTGPQLASLATQRQAQEMQPYLNQGRQLLQAGQIAEADKLARQLVAANIPESAFGSGDTPAKLMVDVARARNQMEQQNIGGVMHPVYSPALDGTYNISVVQGVAGPATVPGGVPTTSADRTPAQTVGDMSRQAAEYEFAAEVQRQITRSQQLMSEEIPKMNDAIGNLKEVRERVETAEITPDMKRSLINRIDHELTQMEDFRVRHGSAIEMADNNARVHAAIAEEREQRSYVEMKLKEFTEEYNALYRAERYEEAAAVAEKARAIAPKHEVVSQMDFQSKIAYRQQAMDQAKDEKERRIWEEFLAQERASIPTVGGTTPLVGPESKFWNGVVQNRTNIGMLGAEQSENERNIFLALEKPISLNTNGRQPLRAVVDRLMSETNINIIIDSQAIVDDLQLAASADAVGSDVSVELTTMNDIKFKSALNHMLRPLNLTYTVRDESLVITTPRRSRSEMTYKAYYVADLVMARPDNRRHRPKTGRDRYRDAMQTAMGRHSGFGVNGMQAPVVPVAMQNSPMLDPSVSRVPSSIMPQIMGGGAYRPAGNYGMGANNNYGSAGGQADFGELISLIMETVAPDTWREGSTTGGRSSGGSTLGGTISEDAEAEGEGTIRPFYNTLTLIIRQTEDNHQQIQELLTQLRKMNDIQISVEVRFITIKDDFFESMGIDFDLNVRNSNRTKFAGLNTGTDSAGDDENATLNTTAFTQAVKNARLFSGLLAGGSSQSPQFSHDLGIGIDQSSYGLTKTPPFGGYQDGAGASLGFAILSDIETYFFMSAAQGDSRSNVLQAPKVMLINGQYGTVYDTTERYFVTGVIPVVGDFAVAQQPVIEIIEEGTELSVQAVVNSDRRYVRMNLAPWFSTIGDTVASYKFEGADELEVITGGTGSEGGGSASESSSGTTVQQPLITEFGVETSVSVPDGGTILLGGVKRLSEGRKEYGVPMVNKIPYLKRLFANTTVGRETQSMMMMVTPTIIIQEEFEQSMSSVVEN